jgi:hypothetical protein
MKKTLYITSNLVAKEYIDSMVLEDFGFDYGNTFRTFQILGNNNHNNYDSGTIKIDSLISKLEEFKKIGGNYVICDWHCDHNELDLYAFKIEKSNSNEIIDFEDKEKKIKAEKEKEIKELEEKLRILKNGLN